MEALTLYVLEKMHHPSNFLIPMFDYQLIFNKHVNIPYFQ